MHTATLAEKLSDFEDALDKKRGHKAKLSYSLRIKLVTEEMNELCDALEDCSLEDTRANRAHVLKEACDAIYVIVGTIVCMGMGKLLAPAFNRVQANNMYKVEGGWFDAVGKLRKPADYKPVELEDLFG